MEDESQIWTGNEQVLDFGPGEAPWTLKHGFQNTLSIAMTGGGKSSGPMAAAIKGMLAQGCGMLYCCVKDDAAADIEALATAVGREQDLVFFGRDDSWRFNPLAFEARNGAGGQAVSMVETIEDLMSIVNPNQSGEAFWRNARGELLKSSIDLLRFAGEEVTIENIMLLVASAPDENTKMQSEEWRESYCAAAIDKAKAASKGTRDERDFLMCERYFLRTFRGLGDKTRGSVVSDVTGLIDALFRGDAGRLFSSDTNITPEDLADGKIIVVDYPVLYHGLAGRLINAGWKYCVFKHFQRNAGARKNDPSARPVFVVIDEYHMVMTASDALSLTTTRSAKVGSLLATQNFSNMNHVLGPNSEHAVSSLLGNIGTLILGSNMSPSTYRLVSDIVGDKRETLTSTGNTDSYRNPLDFVPSISNSHTLSETFRPHLRQEDFLRLTTGGEENDYIVETIIIQAGRKWRDGALFKKVGFDQRS